MLVPESSGTIIRNHGLGGGNDTHFHIDARGATDPAAIHAAAMRGTAHCCICGAGESIYGKKDPSGALRSTTNR